MPRRSLVEYVEQYRRRGAEIAVAHHRGYRMVRWPYARIAQTTAQFARELEARGISKGERILLWGEDSAEWVAAFLGCMLRGVIVVPMDRIAAPEFVRRVAQQVEAKLVVRSRGLPEFDPGLASLLLENLPEIVARHSGEPYPSPAFERSDTLEIVFTSGTTSDPKGVVISHGNLLANLEPMEAEIRHYLGYERIFHPIRFLNLLPLSHVFGQLLGIFVPQLLGGAVIFLDTLSPAEVVRTVKRERVSVLVSVPRLIESLAEKVQRDLEAAGRLDRFRKDFETADGEHFLKRWWRFRWIRRQFGWKFWALISGGAALPSSVETFWNRLGYAVIQGYGLTETTSLVSVNHPFRLGKGSIGKALPGLQVKLDASGEILVRGENVAAGYWQGRRLEPVAGEDAWFHTGDLGKLDSQGNLYFKGRQKNVIVTPAGMNVYPEDLEGALRCEPEVRDCVVVGVSRDGNAEPCAVLLLRDPASDPQPVIERANRALAEYQRIRQWLVWPEQDFPRTSTQKPRLPEIQKVVKERLGVPTSSPLESGALAGLVARMARQAGQAPAGVSREARLEADLNLSSVDRVELLSALEDRYQIDLNEAQFSEAATVGELERLIREPLVPRRNYSYPRWAQRWPITWLRWAIYYLLVWPATYLLAAPRVRGREHLRRVRGPLLVISNHITMIDVGFILAALPARLRNHLAVAMEGERLWAMQHPPAGMNLFRRWLERVKYFLVVALFNVFPLPQQSGYRESFAYAGESVDRGYGVLVFPEGERTRDGRMAPFRAGIGLLATRLDIPIVPMRIDGLFELKQAGKRFARPGQVRVIIGEPVRYGTGQEAGEIVGDLERRFGSLA